jgi:hypothetical protein
MLCLLYPPLLHRSKPDRSPATFGARTIQGIDLFSVLPIIICLRDLDWIHQQCSNDGYSNRLLKDQRRAALQRKLIVRSRGSYSSSEPARQCPLLTPGFRERPPLPESRCTPGAVYTRVASERRVNLHRHLNLVAHPLFQPFHGLLHSVSLLSRSTMRSTAFLNLASDASRLACKIWFLARKSCVPPCMCRQTG